VSPDVTVLDPDGLISDVLVEAAPLSQRVTELGEELSRDYAGRDLLLVGVLKGAVFFMADLVREITVPSIGERIVVRSRSMSA